mgnify:CR=1 FL=1
MKVWIKARGTDSELLDWVRRIDSFLLSNGVEVQVDPVLGHVLKREVLPESEAHSADFAIIVGGDGTLLRTVQKSSGKLPPVIGFTTTSVGFFLFYQASDYENVLRSVFSKNFLFEEVKLGEYMAGDSRGVFLNEISVWSHTGRLIEFEFGVEGEKIYHARADGIIVATPAGSTAHALSYGSPIFMSLDVPTLEVVFVGALSPLIRPLVVYSRKIELQVMTWPAMMVVDGQTTSNLEYSSTISVSPSSSNLKMVVVEGYMRKFNERLKQRLLDRGLSRIV